MLFRSAVNSQNQAADTMAIEATTGSIHGSGELDANAMALVARQNVGFDGASLRVDAGTLAVTTHEGDIYLEELGDVVIGSVTVPSVAAGRPSATMSFGCSSAICRARNGWQAAISSGSGVRLLGGRHFTVLAM